MSSNREVYSFTWPGKHEALLEAGKPTDKTLRPCVEESLNFYDTQNLYIEGDNLEVMKILQRAYMKKIKMIYIDPPYNTGHDFIYRDDFTYTIEKEREQYEFTDDIDTRNFTAGNYFENTRNRPRFHSDWCSMMYPRLKIAHNVLANDGVIFISIDDNEQANLRKICDEVFGENNFIAQIPWKGRSGRQDSKYFAVIHEYILCYAKNIAAFKAGEELKEDEKYPFYDEVKQRNYKTQLLRKWGANSRREDRPNLFYPIEAPDGSKIYPMLSENREGCWRWGQSTMQKAISENRVEFRHKGRKWIAYERIYEGQERTKKYNTWIDSIPNGTETLKQLFTFAPFDYSKSPELIMHFMKMAGVKKDSIVLDFFSGSAATAHAVMNLNTQDNGTRSFIMVQLPELCSPLSEAFKAGYKNICEIGKERIRRAGKNLSGDAGFRVFKLDSSNFNDIYFTAEEFTQKNLDDTIQNIKPDRTGKDLIFDYAVNIGLPLSLEYNISNFQGFEIHKYGHDEITACFDKNLNEEVIKYITKLKTKRVIFLESCFENLISKLNLEQILRFYAPDTELIIL